MCIKVITSQRWDVFLRYGVDEQWERLTVNLDNLNYFHPKQY